GGGVRGRASQGHQLVFLGRAQNVQLLLRRAEAALHHLRGAGKARLLIQGHREVVAGFLPVSIQNGIAYQAQQQGDGGRDGPAV
nr:hypothetical protein [Tanacetum cinerariifolium]